MSARRLKKILKCIGDDDLVKLKRYVKKYDIDVSSVQLPDGAGLLHRACDLGHDAIARFVLVICIQLQYIGLIMYDASR